MTLCTNPKYLAQLISQSEHYSNYHLTPSNLESGTYELMKLILLSHPEFIHCNTGKNRSMIFTKDYVRKIGLELLNYSF
jgi:hypothetical protein